MRSTALVPFRRLSSARRPQRPWRPRRSFSTPFLVQLTLLVRDLSGTLHRIHAFWRRRAPCVGEMNAFIRSALLPMMPAVGRAPYVGAFRAPELSQQIGAAGFDIVAVES